MRISDWSSDVCSSDLQQAPMFDGLPFDPFALFDDGIGPAEVGVGGRHVVQALVVTSVVIMLVERFDLGLTVAGQEVIFEQDAILEGLIPAPDLALSLGMHRSAANIALLQIGRAQWRE